MITKKIAKVTNCYLPWKRIFIRDNSEDNKFAALKIKDAAVHFLLEPFLSDEDYVALGNKAIVTSDYAIHLMSLNSSMWVIGPFVPCKGEESDWLYYHIATALAYHMTPQGTFIIYYIRSLSTEGECISSSHRT